MSETDDRVREGVEHLQTAALELIAAARVLLDLAEEAVKDPSDALAHLAAVTARLRPQPPAPGGAGGARPAGRPGRDDGGDRGFERIRVV